MKYQKGFTSTELGLVLAILAWLTVVGLMGYAVVHFVLKFW